MNNLIAKTLIVLWFAACGIILFYTAGSMISSVLAPKKSIVQEVSEIQENFWRAKLEDAKAEIERLREKANAVKCSVAEYNFNSNLLKLEPVKKPIPVAVPDKDGNMTVQKEPPAKDDFAQYVITNSTFIGGGELSPDAKKEVASLIRDSAKNCPTEVKIFDGSTGISLD